jgi:hypothetical protein
VLCGIQKTTTGTAAAATAVKKENQQDMQEAGRPC